MPLEFTPLEIPYGQLDTHTDPTAMEPGTLTKAENVSSDVDGRYSKRFGYESIDKPTPGTVTAARLAKRKNQLLFHDGQILNRYSSSINSWTTTQETPNVKATQKSIAMEQSRNYLKPSRGSVNGIALHAWIDTST